MRLLTLCVIASFVIGCSGSSPTAPTPRIPSVAGSYTGSITIVYPEVPTTLICPATTTITQSNTAISVAPIILSGPCGRISIPVGNMDIDATGSIGNETGSLNESCGLYNYVASGGFFGREFRFSMNATSRTCLNFNFTATLTR